MIGRRPILFGFLGVFGVLLPVVTIVVEATTHMCAEEFFDPIPTIWHVVLTAIVPAANAHALYALSHDDARHLRVLSIANGLAAGVAAFYSLLFLPLMPIAVIGIVVYLLGLLPLTPFLSLVTTLALRAQLRRQAAESGARVAPLWPVALCALLVLTLADVRVAMTKIRVQQAAVEAGERRFEAVEWLRAYGDDETMLRACYVRRGRSGDLFTVLLSPGVAIAPDQAREVYYRVTGTPFNAVPPPEHLGPEWERQFDADQGGKVVGGVLEGLSLASSRLDGSLDADAALGYLEWTLVFTNATEVQREARAQIALPPGAVVSRLTLWIDGEEREAAFARRAAVRQAYEGVVRQQRDPVLVTTSGPDRVLVQCFPVPPGGGQMKVRLGITTPLALEAADRARLDLPHVVERNFGVDDLRHEVWVEAKQPLEGPGFASERPAADAYAVRGSASGTSPAGFLVARRSPAAVESFAADPTDKSGSVVRQRVAERVGGGPSRVVLAVDGSANMRDHAAALANAIRGLPEGLEVAAVAAGDEPVLIADVRPGTRQHYEAIAERVAEFDYEGGRDNAAALGTAWDLAAASPGAAVVWIHGPQPLLLPGADALGHRFERRPGAVSLLSLQLGAGADRLVESLDGLPDVGSVAGSGGPVERLGRLATAWTPGAPRLVVERERLARAARPAPAAHATSPHLVRLWARDETSRLVAAGGDANLEAATKLAAAHRLVTPVTGAVVLETAEQYRAAGLTPGDPASVPTIPEPEVWLLAAVALAVLAWAVRSRRRVSCEPA